MDRKVGVSLFNGIGVGFLALKQLGIKLDALVSSEINEDSNMVNQSHFPETVQIGDITKVDLKHLKKTLGDVYIVMGGSPCTNFSFAGKRNGMTTITHERITTLKRYLQLKKEGFQFDGQSYLFWEFVLTVKILKPKYFFLENVNMSKEWESVITKELGVLPIRINSNLVSGQNRLRLYWTNIPNVSQPIDKGIKFSRLIGGKSCSFRGRKLYDDDFYTQVFQYTKNDKSNCLVTGGNTNKVHRPDGTVENLTVTEFELLQTLPVGYTKVKDICNTKRKEMIGNSWTLDVIKHIFSNLNE